MSAKEMTIVQIQLYLSVMYIAKSFPDKKLTFEVTV